jgi:hypothetical protein
VQRGQAVSSESLSSEQRSLSSIAIFTPFGCEISQHPKQSQPLGVRDAQVSTQAAETSQLLQLPFPFGDFPVRHSLG